MKIGANILKEGNVIKHNEKVLQVMNTNIIKPGKGGAYIQVDMRDLKNGTKINERWRTSDTVEKLMVEEISVTFLYIADNMINLMNNENFEQFSLKSSILGEKVELLQDGMKLHAEFVDGEVINLKFPRHIKVEINSADAVVKGQTSSSSYKNAITKCNLKILVPPHIKEGDKILIKSENNEYVEKAKE